MKIFKLIHMGLFMIKCFFKEMEMITRYDTFFAVKYACCTILVDEVLLVNQYSLCGKVNDERTPSILKLVKHPSLKFEHDNFKLTVNNPLTFSGLIFSENLRNYYEFVLGCIEVELREVFCSRIRLISRNKLSSVYIIKSVLSYSRDVEIIQSIYSLYDFYLFIFIF
jgi:hypothetical protein